MSTAVAIGIGNEEAQQTIAGLDSKACRQYIAHQGCTVYWRRFGDGPPLVLIHGGHGNWMHWIRNIEVLAQEHTLWIPDLPGFGDSTDLAGHADRSIGYSVPVNENAPRNYLVAQALPWSA